MSTRPPARRPCRTCPYRRDVPSGVWDESEYRKLPDFDGPLHTQPPAVFCCHQQDGRLCAGWVAVHDMNEALGLRLAVLAGAIDPEDVDGILDYATDVPLFSSGAEAAAHGLRDLLDPGLDARRAVGQLDRKRRRPTASG